MVFAAPVKIVGTIVDKIIESSVTTSVRSTFVLYVDRNGTKMRLTANDEAWSKAQKGQVVDMRVQGGNHVTWLNSRKGT